MIVGSREFDLTRPVIMGIVNMTPDSFFDGGLYNSPPRALKHIEQFIEDGVDIVDIGGESTRPGSRPVNSSEELRRVIPVIERVRKLSDVPISIDTRKAHVAREAIKAGASMINDVSAGRDDPAMFDIAASMNVPICLMHMKGNPETMQRAPMDDKDVLAVIFKFLKSRIRAAEEAGIPSDNIIIDPGIGFGKTAEDNVAILRNVDRLLELTKPILVGTSRKSFIGKTLNFGLEERLEATLATLSETYRKGVRIFRVHDVGAARRYFAMLDLLGW
jgi:dihydropteroate synthase